MQVLLAYGARDAVDSISIEKNGPIVRVQLELLDVRTQLAALASTASLLPMYVAGHIHKMWPHRDGCSVLSAS